MLDSEELKNIKVGDIIEWTERHLGHEWVEEGEVTSIVCKAGFDHVKYCLDVHIHHYPNEDYDTEVNYEDIIRIHKAED